MGRQKGKGYPGKKSTGNRNRLTSSVLTKKQVQAEQRAAAKAAPVPEGDRTQAPVGLPSGWFAYKRPVVSGKEAGKVWIRFASADGKHKDISTVGIAIRRDAAEKGYDPKSALEAFEKRKAEAEQQRQKQTPAPPKAGSDAKAVEAFRKKHSRLDTATIAHLPGWSVQTRLSKDGQKLYIFTGPKGETARQLVQVEAALGAEILAGREVVGLEAAREKGSAVKRKYVSKNKRRQRSLRSLRSARKDKMSVDAPKKEASVKKKILKK